jgi:hypothetical protein
MRWARHVEGMEVMTNEYRILVSKFTEKILLKCTLKEYYWRVWTGLN